MRRALENSALRVDGLDALGQGNGLLQVEPAWEYLTKMKDHQARDIRFDISVNSERFSRGIYLRQTHESRIKNTFNVSVSVVFKPKTTTPETKVNFEQRLVLRASESWVTCAEYLELVGSGKDFAVSVDPRGLAYNAVHTAVIRAYEYVGQVCVDVM